VLSEFDSALPLNPCFASRASFNSGTSADPTGFLPTFNMDSAYILLKTIEVYGLALVNVAYITWNY
jgi:hypothetical protein